MRRYWGRLSWLHMLRGGARRVDVVRNSGVAPCVRSHVPSGDNQYAGRSLGRQVQSERILEGDQVVITP
ncbi:hypothetical protein [Streptomyces xanthochromogenes]|uniref:MOSC domain-containing protein n=1 Tax=Streptomyces xanthochromogenes TaxID=67384 RepID=A0ABQ2ZH61_9ACTN|nr:hypothetical protein [Streptomyces xanthochromogenes]GGY13138.1 hypothetical protein GCM10010326_00390 [Streptomyces xanthochromogenes]